MSSRAAGENDCPRKLVIPTERTNVWFDIVMACIVDFRSGGSATFGRIPTPISAIASASNVWV
jgi:hypothetical protein